MTRTIWHRIFWGLLAAALGAGYVFALHGNDPSWMMATFWLALGAVITGAWAITQA